MKKLFSLLCLMSLSFPVFSGQQENLEYAQYLASKKIIKHWDDPKNYRFDDTIVRSEIMGMALAMAGITRNTVCRGEFADVPYSQTDWVCRTIETAADHGFINAQWDKPKSYRKVRPYDSITRSEALGILLKAVKINFDVEKYCLEHAVPDTDLGCTALGMIQSNFHTKIIQPWQLDVFITYYAGVLQKFILETDSTYSFRVHDRALRAEVFEFAYRIMQFSENACSTERIYGNGYSFCLPPHHTWTKGTTQNPIDTVGFTLTYNKVDSMRGETITIKEFAGSSYTDRDAKFGDATVSFNVGMNKWVTTKTCQTPGCTSQFIINSLPVFLGTSRWLTYIVPLKINHILVINSTGGGYTEPLEKMIQTLRAE